MNPANVIIITIDECKASAMSPYGNNPVFTPAAELAARQGVTFENSFTCHPKCVPSRCCLMSGRYSHTNGHRTLPGYELSHGESNLAAILIREGYVTGMFGKNHTVEEEYKYQIFDEYTKEIRGSINTPQEGCMQADDPMYRAFYRGRWEDGHKDEPRDYYNVEDGIDFIKRHKEEAFFLLMNLNMPHPVYWEMSPYIKMIREKGIALPPKHSLENTPSTLRSYRKAYNLEMLTDEQWQKIIEAYYSMVSYIDNQVLKIYEAVKKYGLESNTLIIYTSDHGDFAGEHGCTEKYDTMFYDCLIKIPLYIQYPPLIPSGVKLASLVENVDILPTVLDILNLPVPGNVHGKSLLPYISGKVHKHKDSVFCEGGVEEQAIRKAPHYDSPECERMKPNYYWKQVALVDYPLSMQRSKMVRTHEWKLVYRQNGEKELYNILKDPEEFCNRAQDPECREVLFELMQMLIEWLIKTEPDFPDIDRMFA